jgi:hypothetical protein
VLALQGRRVREAALSGVRSAEDGDRRRADGRLDLGRYAAADDVAPVQEAPGRPVTFFDLLAIYAAVMATWVLIRDIDRDSK